MLTNVGEREGAGLKNQRAESTLVSPRGCQRSDGAVLWRTGVIQALFYCTPGPTRAKLAQNTSAAKQK